MNPILQAIDQSILDLFEQVLNVFVYSLPEILTIFVGLVGLGIVTRFIVTMIGGNPTEEPKRKRHYYGFQGEWEDEDNPYR